MPVSRTFGGAPDYLSATRSLPTAYPITIASWIKPSEATTAGVAHLAAAAGGKHWLGLTWNSTGVVLAESAAIGTANSATTNTISVGTWGHVAGVFGSATSRTAYCNGIAATVNTTNISFPTGLITYYLGAKYRTDLDDFLAFRGSIAHPAVWNVALTDSEILALAQGALPGTIRPQNLIFAPNLTGAVVEFDPVRANHATQTGNSAVGEDPLSYPARLLRFAKGAIHAIAVANPNANEIYLAAKYGITL